MSTPEPTVPVGSWTHSFEEDTDGLEVYRPTLGYPFPPTRQGRRRLVFGGDRVTEAAPGPDDRPVPTGATPGIEVVETGPDLLKIRRL